MPTVSTTYLGDLHVECVHERSGARFVTDAPVDNKGKGEAFSPTDLAAAALASCQLTIMGIYADSRNLDIAGARVDVEKTMSAAPRRIGAFDVTVTMPDKEYTEKDKKGLEAAARSCPVMQSLHPDTKKNLTFVWAR
ncbi:MAG: OsmC family protein [Desulfovibrio sp.]|jgi:uncharacterized OsmC-like protein|nr:OsmC family protein [Desulfovibrio sp.]